MPAGCKSGGRFAEVGPCQPKTSLTRARSGGRIMDCKQQEMCIMEAFAYRLRGFVGILVVCAVATGQAGSQTSSPRPEPLPDPATYLQAASDKEDAFAAVRQQYLCVFENHKTETLMGVTKKDRLYESFYVNGYEVERLLAFNGVPLSAEQKQAEESRVQAEIAADQKKPFAPFIGMEGGIYFSRGAHRWSQTVEGSIVRAATFTNEQRGLYKGRVSIRIDFTGNPKFKAKTDEERVAKVLSGFIVVDEESGSVVRVMATAMGEVYGSAGLLMIRGANIGYDAMKIADNLYLPSSWGNYHYTPIDIRALGHPPKSYAGFEDFWLKSCRKYPAETQGTATAQ